MQVMTVSIEAGFHIPGETSRSMRIHLLPLLCWLLLGGVGITNSVMADEASHRASAVRFLKLANAESMTTPVYDQVERLITAHFSQMGGSMQYESVLRRYQQQARQMLDQELAWDALRDELVDLYLPLFSEEEFEQLAQFYQSPAGRKLMKHLPLLTRESMAISSVRVKERIEPGIQGLLGQMTEEIEARQQGLR
jgi:hypothetical protein